MLHIDVLAVGRIKEQYMREGTLDYLRRLKPYVKIKAVEVDDESAPERISPKDKELVRNIEGERLGRHLRDSFVAALDMEGKMYSSEELAGLLESLPLLGVNRIQFLIGGSLGLAPEILKRSSVQISLSRLTFPHQLARLILLEQIYRACKILRGEPYHK